MHNPLTGTLCSEVPFSHSRTSTSLISFLILLESGSKIPEDAMLAGIWGQPGPGKRVTAVDIGLLVPREQPQVAVTIKPRGTTPDLTMSYRLCLSEACS